MATNEHQATPSAPVLPWDAEGASGRTATLAGILAQVSREALEGEGLDAVLQQIVDCLIRRLPVPIASIILLDEQGTHFTQEVWAGELDLDSPAVASGWPVTKGAAGRCARSGQAQLIIDVEHDPDYISGNSAVRSEYLVPIRHRRRVLGVLNIESRHAGFFTADVCLVFDAIANQVGGAIHLARMAGELEIANRKLAQLSMSDGLTGIANRRCFDLRLASDWAQLASDGRPLALLLVDADCFKALNDDCGHLHGDECLRQLARICARFAEDDLDLAARYGGEELVLLLPGRDHAAAHAIAERLRLHVEAAAIPHPTSTVAPHLTVSVGVGAMRPDATLLPELLVDAADRALYIAKSRGRNCVVSSGT
jgi:diguanylate cyclase (GGDEF)-like protein